MTNFRYYWRLWFGWFPLQPCMNCTRWYWGGLPWPPGWQAAYQEFCCAECADQSEQFWDGFMGTDPAPPVGPCMLHGRVNCWDCNEEL